MSCSRFNTIQQHFIKFCMLLCLQSLDGENFQLKSEWPYNVWCNCLMKFGEGVWCMVYEIENDYTHFIGYNVDSFNLNESYTKKHEIIRDELFSIRKKNYLFSRVSFIVYHTIGRKNTLNSTIFYYKNILFQIINLEYSKNKLRFSFYVWEQFKVWVIW